MGLGSAGLCGLATMLGVMAQVAGAPAFPGPHVHTAPARAANATLRRLSFGSCNHQRLPQDLWPAVRASAPELWLWLGDNIYGDVMAAHAQWPYVAAKTRFPDAVVDDWVALASVEDYAALAGDVPMLATWDDHDFGKNDGDKRFVHRAAAQQLFLDFFGVGPDDRRRRRQGVYVARDYGPPGRRVRVVLLDNRYAKDPYEVGPLGDMLGPEQWAWLEEQLRPAPGDVQLVLLGAGLQMLPRDRVIGEHWGRFSASRERLLRLVTQAPSPVILLSGDVHYSEITGVVCSRRASDGTVYEKRLAEITSSGMTHAWGDANEFMGRDFLGGRNPVKRGLAWFLNSVMNPSLFWLMLRIYPSAYRHDNLNDVIPARSFGTLELDWSGPRVAARMEFRGKHGETLLRRDVSFSNVADAGDTGGHPYECLPFHEERRPTSALMLALKAGLLLYAFVRLVQLPFKVLAFLWRRSRRTKRKTR